MQSRRLLPVIIQLVVLLTVLLLSMHLTFSTTDQLCVDQLLLMSDARSLRLFLGTTATATCDAHQPAASVG